MGKKVEPSCPLPISDELIKGGFLYAYVVELGYTAASKVVAERIESSNLSLGKICRSVGISIHASLRSSFQKWIVGAEPTFGKSSSLDYSLGEGNLLGEEYTVNKRRGSW